MAEVLRVDQVQRDAYLVLFRDSSQHLKAWLASPRFSAVLCNTGFDTLPNELASTAKVSFSVEKRSFTLNCGLRGGGCNLSKAISNLEPEMPASSPEQRDVALKVKNLHAYQQESDFVNAFSVHTELREFLKGDLLKPFAVLRTLIEAYTSLDWNGKLCTSWLLVTIKELLDKVFLVMTLEKQAISPSSKQYLRQLLDIMLEEDEKNMRLDLYLKCYLQIIMSGLDAISGTAFPEDEEVRKKIAGTLALLRGQSTDTTEVVNVGSDFYRLSLFHRALSLEVAAIVGRVHSDAIDYLLTYLRADTALHWSLRYLAMLKLAELMNYLEAPAQKRVLEGHLPRAQGLVHILSVNEGEDAWMLRAGAYHAFVYISQQATNEEVKETANTTLEGAKAVESDPRVKNFMRQSASLRKIYDPRVEEFIDQPTQFLMTFPSGVGRAYLADLITKTVSIFEKDFLHGSSRVIITKKNLAIVTGGADHPTHSYEVSLQTGEYLRMAELCEGRYWHAVTMLDNVIYITGGRNKREVLRSVECYKGGKWELINPMNLPRDSHNAVTANRKIYVFGGTGSEDSINSIEVLSEGEWTLLPVKIPEPRTSPALLFITPSKVLIAGGKYQKDRKEVWQLDLETGAATELPKLPASCSFTSNPVSVRNGFVYMLSSEEQELIEFDLIEQTWTVYDTPVG